MFETEVRDLLKRVIATLDEPALTTETCGFNPNDQSISKEAEIASGETAFCCISPYLRFKDVQIASD